MNITNSQLYADWSKNMLFIYVFVFQCRAYVLHAQITRVFSYDF